MPFVRSLIDLANLESGVLQTTPDAARCAESARGGAGRGQSGHGAEQPVTPHVGIASRGEAIEQPMVYAARHAAYQVGEAVGYITVVQRKCYPPFVKVASVPTRQRGRIVFRQGVVDRQIDRALARDRCEFGICDWVFLDADEVQTRSSGGTPGERIREDRKIQRGAEAQFRDGHGVAAGCGKPFGEPGRLHEYPGYFGWAVGGMVDIVEHRRAGRTSSVAGVEQGTAHPRKLGHGPRGRAGS